MQTRVSTKGQVVLPGPIRRQLGLQPGDSLDADIRDGRIVLTPHRTATTEPRIINDPLTGLPVLTVGAGGAILTGEQVREILSNFP